MQVPFRVRSQSELPKCAVEGCNGYPDVSLWDREFCSTHAEQLEQTVARKYHDAFIGELKARCEKTELRFEQEPYQYSISKTSPCSVMSCREAAITGNGELIPYKHPGRVYLCEKHNNLFWTVNSSEDKSRLLWELSRVRSSRKDKERQRLVSAVREITPKYKGQKDYILSVCKELRVRKLPMFDKWLQRWKQDQKISIEPTNWPRAYQEKLPRAAIQKFISRYRKR